MGSKELKLLLQRFCKPLYYLLHLQWSDQLVASPHERATIVRWQYLYKELKRFVNAERKDSA